MAVGTDAGTVFRKPVGNNHQVLYKLTLYVCLCFDDNQWKNSKYQILIQSGDISDTEIIFKVV